MSTLFVNGISLEVVRTLECSRRAEYDSANGYLWTRWRIHVRCIFNPSATSYAGAIGQEVPTPGSTPALTDESIRHYLMQPRKKVIYTMAGPGPAPGAPPALGIDGLGGAGGTLVILEAPPSGLAGPNFTGSSANDQYLTDANNGPTPIACNVRRIDGLRSWHVEYVTEICQNECFNYYSSPAVILSQRWRQTHDIDRHGFTVRRVEGRCIFRSDVLGNNVKPDDFRAALFHPIPSNCERQRVVVTQEEDPCVYRYSYEDHEVSHNILVANVAHLECTAHVRQYTPGVQETARAVARPFSGGLAHLFDFNSVLDGALPRISCTVTVRAWGNRQANRAQLRNVCMKVLTLKLPAAYERVTGLASHLPIFSINAEAIYDLVGRYCELRQTFICSLAQNLPALAGAGADDVFPALMEMDIRGIATTANTDGRMAIVNDPLTPGVRNRARGSWLGACITSALSLSCSNPGAPVDQAAKAKQLPVPGAA